MKQIRNIIFFSILIFLLSCKNDDECIRKVKKIDIVSAFNKKQNIKLSTLVSEIEYKALETKKDLILGNSQRAFVNSKYIVVIAFRQQYIFDRKTGLFIREIGHYGRGPGGYLFTKSNMAFNDVRNVLYSGGTNRGIFEYSIQGELLKEIPKPAILNAYRSFTSINDSSYISYIPNFSGQDSVKLAIVDRNGELCSTLQNYNTFIDNPKKHRNWGEKEGWFYRYKGRLYLKEMFNDTIFEIGIAPFNIVPKYVFELEQYQADYTQREFMTYEDMQDYFWINNVCESSKYIFFMLEHNEEFRTGIYEKREDVTFIADSEDVDSYYYDWEKYGLINDIDNFIQMNPENISSNNELVCIIQAYELVNWFKTHPDKAAKLPPHLLKLKDIKETDNPIIMIAKLKE